jgi:hypothetical protein
VMQLVFATATLLLYLTREADRAQNPLPRPDPLPATGFPKISQNL